MSSPKWPRARKTFERRLQHSPLQMTLQRPPPSAVSGHKSSRAGPRHSCQEGELLQLACRLPCELCPQAPAAPRCTKTDSVTCCQQTCRAQPNGVGDQAQSLTPPGGNLADECDVYSLALLFNVSFHLSVLNYECPGDQHTGNEGYDHWAYQFHPGQTFCWDKTVTEYR